MVKAQEIKRIAKFALFGAVGFGIGGPIIWGIVWFLPRHLFHWSVFYLENRLSSWEIPLLIVVAGFMGVFGGAALGLALNRGQRKTAFLAIAGVVSFSAGAFLAILPAGFLMGLREYWLFGYPNIEEVWLFVVFGSVLGLVGGMGLGLAMMGRRKFVGLAIAGALGFGIGHTILGMIVHYFESSILLSPWTAIPGIIGGAFLGAALGFLEKGSQTST
jgi:MFS family permease